jgi:hypothetical protein
VSFGGDIERFNLGAKAVGEKVLRKSAFDLFSSIVRQTPVKTGVLRNNWFATIGIPSTEISEETDGIAGRQLNDKRVSDEIDKVVNAADWSSTIYLTNNLEYAIPIEYDGWSAQAPQGMVRVNTARWDSIVKNNIKAAI